MQPAREDDDKPSEKPHYSGHRDRLRERFLKGPDALPDYELLELILFMAIPRRDVKPIAKKLEQRFGSLRGVLAATPAELAGVEGISDTTAIALKTVQAAALRLRHAVEDGHGGTATAPRTSSRPGCREGQTTRSCIRPAAPAS